MPDDDKAEMADKAEDVKSEGDKQDKQTPEQLQAELEKTRTALKAANKEAADRRKRLAELETAETERKAAEMTEAQKLNAKLEKLEAEKNAALEKASNSLKRAAILSKAGDFIDADDVVGALAGKLEINDAGDVDGLDEALAALKKAKPHWLKAKQPGGRLSPGNPGGATEGETDAQRRKRLGL
jgi:DNA repair exonuclease SbcCD ATPase subunit